MTSVLHQRLHEAEHLADDLNGLLAHYGSTLENAGVRKEVEELARLAECYRHGLHYGILVSDKIHQDRWLTVLRNRLRTEARELQRLENEGGPTGGATSEIYGIKTETEDFIGAVQQANSIISRAAQLFDLPEIKSKSGR